MKQALTIVLEPQELQALEMFLTRQRVHKLPSDTATVALAKLIQAIRLERAENSHLNLALKFSKELDGLWHVYETDYYDGAPETQNLWIGSGPTPAEALAEMVDTMADIINKEVQS